MGPLLLLPLGAVALGLCIVWLERRSPPSWRVFAEGTLQNLEYKKETETSRSGSMVHTTHYETVWHTTIYFEGGAVIYDIPGKLEKPKTTAVRLTKSSRGDYRLDPWGR